ncbi:MAG: ATP-dependent Clp protease adaptor ClpS [Muribaculaceae bacterium]|nr:ATP-dependent Clp protease adaptor ClpS [Muribaculaceae bacterium]
MRVATPERYNVFFHNYDFTPMDFVVEILKTVFYKNDFEATSLMLDVHHRGKALVGNYSYDIAASRQKFATDIARRQGYPLKITVERS